ncbi:32756_t:CDS:2, partial [Gigaspora margarita]
LMDNYPEVQAYCERVLYPTKESWAHAFTKQSFSANTHSTQRVESINQVIKLEVNSGNSLYQLQSKIELRLKDEELNHRHNAGFIEDDYEEPQILLDMVLEDCSGSNIIEI